MKKILFIFSIVTFFVSCKETTSKKAAEVKNQQVDTTTNQVIAVAAFKGQQVTGVTLTDAGRIFVNFPRWRKGVDNSHWRSFATSANYNLKHNRSVCNAGILILRSSS